MLYVCGVRCAMCAVGGGRGVVVVVGVRMVRQGRRWANEKSRSQGREQSRRPAPNRRDRRNLAETAASKQASSKSSRTNQSPRNNIQYTHVVFFFFSALLHQTAHDSVQLSLSDILYARTQTLLSSLVRVTTYISLTVASAAVEWRSFVPPGAYLAFRLRPCDALTRL